MSNIDIAKVREELDRLKVQVHALEDLLDAEESDPVKTFDVTLRMTTRSSTWGVPGFMGLSKDEVFQHFSDFLGEIAEVTNLVDEDDSIKVMGVTEVKFTDDNA